MAAYWDNATEDIVRLAGELIDLYHPTLDRARIGILMRSEAPRSNGRETWGKASKITDKWRPLLKRDLDFVIWLAQDVWDRIPQPQRRALLDHELTHCYLDKEDKPHLRPHDIEEFTDVIKRHGLWRSDLATFAQEAQEQLIKTPRRGFVTGALKDATEAGEVKVSLQKSTVI